MALLFGSCPSFALRCLCRSNSLPLAIQRGREPQKEFSGWQARHGSSPVSSLCLSVSVVDRIHFFQDLRWRETQSSQRPDT